MRNPFRSTLILCLSLPWITGCSPPRNEFVDPPPPKVGVAKPLQQDVTIFIKENGETEPVEEAEVRSRVSGFIENVAFRPGQAVQAGDLLYEIERDQYEADRQSAAALLDASVAAIAVAEAAKVKAEAEVLRTERDFKRQEALLAKKAISESDYDAALSERDSAVANLQAAEANIEAAKADKNQAEAALDQAQLSLSYTEVRAAISGYVTKTAVKQGNLVDFGVPLANIVNRDEIFVNFNISDRLLLALLDAYGAERSQDKDTKNREEQDRETWRDVPVFAKSESANANWLRGNLDYVDREGVDRDTGTFGMRARFDNADRKLVPGLFMQVRVPIAQRKQALLIPLRALQRSQLGDSVSVIGPQNEVERRYVRLGEQLDSWVIVEEGLSPDEFIVIEGLMKARPGLEVEPETIELSTDQAPIFHIEDLFN